MCALAQVSRAGFYRWLQPDEGAEEEDMQLREAIEQIALRHRHYGYRRIAAELRNQGIGVNVKRVRRLMNQDGLLAIRRRKFVATTDSRGSLRVYPNLASNLELNDVDQLWVADFTYIRLREQFAFLAVVVDGYSRRAVGWAVSGSMDTRLQVAALDSAIQRRCPRPGLVHHSDAGSQYASAVYVDRLEQIQAISSMSRPGRPWENGKCESFIKTVKKEQIEALDVRNLAELEEKVEHFIERYYNRERLHSALGYQSPEQFENRQTANRASARTEWKPAAMSFLRHREIYSDVS